MQINLWVLSVLTLLVLSRCMPESYSPKPYSEYLKNVENGLTNRIVSGPLAYELTYIPAPLLAYQKLAAGDIKEEVYEQEVSTTSEFAHFELVIKSAKPDETITNALKRISGDDKEKEEAVNNFIAYGMESHLSLESPSDSLIPAFCQYIPTGAVNNARNIMIAFEKNTSIAALNTDGEFTINIAPGLINPEMLRFTFKENDIKQLPKLSF